MIAVFLSNKPKAPEITNKPFNLLQAILPNKKARKYREKALSLTEDGYFFHYFLKAFNKSKNHQIEEAVFEFENLLKLKNPPHDQALVHYMLGELYQQLGRNDQAINHLKPISTKS